MATPKVTRTLFDNNLDRNVPQGPQNRRVVILGTAQDGPMYEAVKVTSSADASAQFGEFAKGSLVRGIVECFNAQVGSPASPDIWGMRIGGVKADRSVLKLYDAAGSGDTQVASLEALNEGSLYNSVYLKYTTDTEGSWVTLYNPKTKLTSKYSADLDIDALVSAINADSNAKDIVFAYAESFELDALEEFDSNDADTTVSGDNLIVDLYAKGVSLAGSFAGTFPVKKINSLYTVSASAEQILAKGDQIYAITDNYVGDSGSYYTICETATMSDAVGDQKAVWSIDGDAGYFNTSDLVDDAADLDFTEASGNVHISLANTGIANVANSGQEVSATFTSTSGVPQAISGYLNIASEIGTFVSSNSCTLTGDLSVTFTFDAIAVGFIKGNGGTPRDFSIDADGNIRFGAAAPFALKFRYARKKFFEEGSNLTITNEATGLLKIVDPGMEAMVAPNNLWIGVNYDYVGADPDWGNKHAGQQYLAGGANGIQMTNAELKNDLDKAYEHFVADFFDIMCVVDLTLDATDNAADEFPWNVSSGSSPMNFGGQLSTFLDEFNGEMIGLIGFEPMTGTGIGGRIKREDVAERVKWLTDADSSKAYKAATILSDFNQPFMYAADLEGIFSERGARYSGMSTAAIAGLIAAIPTEEAIFRFAVPGVQGMRYRYTEIDKASGSRQVDVLADKRIATGRIDGDGVKITESRTLAKPGSDFENLMTVLILQEVLQICRTVAQDYIGKVSSAPLLQAFQSALDKGIGDSLVPRALRGFKAPIQMSPGERVLGKITIPLTLSPQFEIRDVHYNVQLTAEDIV